MIAEAHIAPILLALEDGGLRDLLRELVRHANREQGGAEVDLAAPWPVPSSGLPAGGLRWADPAAALARAEREWVSCVEEPPGRGADRIDSYIRGPEGLGWPGADASRLGVRAPYRNNGQFAWCGAFAAWCWAAAGLHADLRRRVMPSTYRLRSWAIGTPRMVVAAELQPGDLVVVGPADGSGPAAGSHITLCRGTEFDGLGRGQAAVLTYEGNARGELGDGRVGEGVVRHRRPLTGTGRTYVVRYGVRPLAEDCVP